MTMTITEIVSTTMLLLALGAPATAQEKEATASGETAAQANEPDRAEAATRAQAAQERAEAAKLGRLDWEEWKAYRDEGRP